MASPPAVLPGPPQQALVEVLGIATALSDAKDLRTLLQLILRTCRRLTCSDAGSIFLVERPDLRRDPHAVETLWFAASQNHTLDRRAEGDGQISGLEGELMELRFPLTPDRLVGWSALAGEILNIEDVYALDPDLPYQFDPTMDRNLNYKARSMLMVPMKSTTGKVVGVVQLINRKHDGDAVITPETVTTNTRPYDGFDRQLIEALASQAAVCVERTQLLDAQEKLIDSMVALLAGAIDAKSPYTGGHCERVPELAVMLATEADRATEGPLAGFSMGGEDEWREFRIGAYLHDCGKITTPEYVVDKATKLETIYNRIHEIRTRFEVLLRDAEIDRLRGHLEARDPKILDEVYAARKRQLEEDYIFICDANIGAESFGPDKIERLKVIGQQTWLRHFDDGLGLSWAERERRVAGCGDPLYVELPVEERLLCDKSWHRIPRDAHSVPDERYGFRMDIPELLYNQGEIHNLSISRGTLTPEERYKINEHIVQTIIMLENMPFPPGLSRVVDIAGTHHETLDGRGYPRRLKGDQLSVRARIMTIADIFEALTAGDRPYKPAKTLSDSIRILAGFRDRSHIDPDLFALFLRSGVYRLYANRFLHPDQIDEVDIDQYL
ncbi:GAF domain-containing protein [Synechococcus sp. RSCCF101]|uniref:GAF and HD-GYP domain-containing protein n=1 Tax=Synechococcus sp. RSCCF101 TaxID=2511069 RepID=UPI0012458381|nr:HD family phosphohydrolase [Synechococcus sp. RSCCF101]QEY32777.1 GAF domain-containing protein [Synechococcus sp. RSCCF101]